MVIDTIINEEYHPNGQLFYTETICYIAPAFVGMYENVRLNPDGRYWIRRGRCAKYFDNGQLAWELNYKENGAVNESPLKSFRKDGTPIQF